MIEVRSIDDSQIRAQRHPQARLDRQRTGSFIRFPNNLQLGSGLLAEAVRVLPCKINMASFSRISATHSSSRKLPCSIVLHQRRRDASVAVTVGRDDAVAAGRLVDNRGQLGGRELGLLDAVDQTCAAACRAHHDDGRSTPDFTYSSTTSQT